jgi:hypothetical protein
MARLRVERLPGVGHAVLGHGNGPNGIQAPFRTRDQLADQGEWS